MQKSYNIGTERIHESFQGNRRHSSYFIRIFSLFTSTILFVLFLYVYKSRKCLLQTAQFVERGTGNFTIGSSQRVPISVYSAWQSSNLARKCTFVFVCGYGDTDTVEEMRSMIISAILLTSCPLHFVIISDDQTTTRLNNTLQTEFSSTTKPLSFDIWSISTRFIEKWANNFKFDVNGFLQNKRIWLITKLYVPFLLRDYDKVIVIDTDMVFLQDPAILWDQFNEGSDSWAYKMPMNDLSSENHICSCVVLINVQNVLSRNLYPIEYEKALQQDAESFNEKTGLYQTKRVDQAVYYLLQKRRPELFRSLDQRFNIDHCHHYYNRLNDRNRSEEMVAILHMNCPMFRFNGHETGNTFFNFFKAYRSEWLRDEKRNNYTVDISFFVDEEAAAMTRFGLM